MPADQKLLPSDDRSGSMIEKALTKDQKKFDLPHDDERAAGKILVDDQTPGGSPGKPPRASRPRALADEQKSKMYTNRLLLFKLEMYRMDIERILDRYLQSKVFQNIDCKRHFDDVFEAFQTTIKVAVCNQSDLRRQQSRKTDPACVK